MRYGFCKHCFGPSGGGLPHFNLRAVWFSPYESLWRPFWQQFTFSRSASYIYSNARKRTRTGARARTRTRTHTHTHTVLFCIPSTSPQFHPFFLNYREFNGARSTGMEALWDFNGDLKVCPGLKTTTMMLVCSWDAS